MSNSSPSPKPGDLGHMPPPSQRKGIDIATARRLFGATIPGWLKTLANSIYGGAQSPVELVLATIYPPPRNNNAQSTGSTEEGDAGASWQTRLGRHQGKHKAGKETMLCEVWQGNLGQEH